MDEYDLLNIKDRFFDNAEKWEKSHGEMKEYFIKNCPDVPLSDYLKDDFSLPRALGTMCDEIIRIKKAIGND